MNEQRSWEVKALTRVEGEGRLYVRLRNQQVEHVELNIYEPPRFFEAFLRGREIREVPDITARICGICPIAYQMTACHALERALGLTISAELRNLRRLLYCGEWIESHGLHIHLLHLPDFLGFESGLSMVTEHREVVERGLRLKKIGNDLLTVLGGRAIHPINVTVGGFYRAPRVDELTALLPDIHWGLEASTELLDFLLTLPFPDFEQPYELVSLRHSEEYPMNEGRIVSSRGLDIDVTEYERHFQEVHRPQSTALHSVRIPGEGTYLCGPSARLGLCREQLTPRAARAVDAMAIAWPSYNPFHSIIARAVELVVAFEEAARLVSTYRRPARARHTIAPTPGAGCHATEAPRGLIYHRYAIGDDGLIAEAKIVPPTSQNQGQIEADLRAFIPRVVALDDEEATRRCEHLIRNYDPCISCATHFLTMTIEREPSIAGYCQRRG